MEAVKANGNDNLFYLVRDLRRKTHRVVADADSPEFEILYAFEPKPFPDLTCMDCGTVGQDVKYRDYSNGTQCYNCYKSDREFEDEYR